jgi:hypothetical protein
MTTDPDELALRAAEDLNIFVMNTVAPIASREPGEQARVIATMKASGFFPKGSADFAEMLALFEQRANERWQRGDWPADEAVNIRNAILGMRVDLAAWQAQEKAGE